MADEFVMTQEEDVFIMNKDSKRRRKLTDFQLEIIALKKHHGDKLLMFEHGYQFKFFGEDAIVISRALNYNLKPGWESTFEAPNGGFKSFASVTVNKAFKETAIRGLIGRGFKIGIVSSLICQDGVIRRRVSDVYSSGTSYYGGEEEEEKGGGCRSIVCLYETGDDVISVVSINAFLGNVIYDEFKDDLTRTGLRTRLMYLEPIEVILVGDEIASGRSEECVRQFKIMQESSVSDMIRIVKDVTSLNMGEMVKKVYDQGFSEGVFSFICNLEMGLMKCIEALIRYLEEFKLVMVLNRVEFYKNFEDVCEEYMVLDSIVLRNLEIFQNVSDFTERGTLMEFLDNTMTRMGRRELKQWLKRPLINRERIIKRREVIATIIEKRNSNQMKRMGQFLKLASGVDLPMEKMRIYNLKSSRIRVYKYLKFIEEAQVMWQGLNKGLYSVEAFGGGGARGQGLYEIFQRVIKVMNSEEVNELVRLKGMIHSPAAMDEKTGAVEDYFNGRHEGLGVLNEKRGLEMVIKAELEDELDRIRLIVRKPDLKWTHIPQGGYLVTVRVNEIGGVPEDWKRVHGTVNTVSYSTPKSFELVKKLNGVLQEVKRESDELFDKFMVDVNKGFAVVGEIGGVISEVDVLVSWGKVCERRGLNQVNLSDKAEINVRGMWNPVLSGVVIVNDVEFDGAIVMSGPNMGGKSTMMRSVGLNVIMNQVGGYVACDGGGASKASEANKANKASSGIGVFNKLIVRLGAGDDIMSGQSTFEREMVECLGVFQPSGGASLVLLDEIGRGTSSVDGNAIAWSVIEYLRDCEDTLSVVTTHYSDIQWMEGVEKWYMGYEEIGEDHHIKFTYMLKHGFCPRSFGIHCGQVSGVPSVVIDEAKAVADGVEREASGYRLAQMLMTVEDLY